MNIANRKEWDAANETSDTIEAVANRSCVLYNHLGKLEQYQGNRRIIYRYTAQHLQEIQSRNALVLFNCSKQTMPNFPSIASGFEIEIVRNKVKISK